MADQKAKKTKGLRNDARQSGKAWKVRPCGRRHDPKPCGQGNCVAAVKK